MFVKIKKTTVILLLAVGIIGGITGCDMSPPSLPSNASPVILPQQESENQTGLTIFNLPPHLSAKNISNVLIHDQAGTVAKCDNYSLIKVNLNNGKAEANIPLVYQSFPSPFTETGVYYVSFDINVDVHTRYLITRTNRAQVSFINGIGFMDIENIDFFIQEAEDEVLSYLTIVNLPANMSAQNISNVLVHDLAGPVAKCSNYSLVEISAANDSATVRVPLVYQNLNFNFAETGLYYVSFDINVDVTKQILLSKDDRVQISFLNGNGYLDIENLSEKYIPYVTIHGLPSNTSNKHFSDIAVYNQAGVVAKCNNTNDIIIFRNNDNAVAMIPLSYSSGGDYFQDTGSFVFTFTVNADVETQISFKRNDGLSVYFSNGSAFLDIGSIPKKQIPYVTILGLPSNTSNKHFSDIAVYNQAGVVAKCNNTNDIIISKESGYAVAKIPLSYSSGGDYFQDTGSFVFTFTVNVDVETQISFNQKDGLSLNFSNGTASLDLANSIGFFNAQLVNPSDNAAPRIKANSSFDVNGSIYKVPADTSINSALPSAGGVIYIYAYRSGSDMQFEYSTQAPVYTKGKGGYYQGNKRALWKMLLLIDSGNKFLFKTYIDDPWPHLATYIAGNGASVTSSFPVQYSLSGSNNPSPATVTLQPGIYIVRLTGAGGGGGFGSIQDGDVSGSSSGGTGGIVTEVLTLNSSVTFSAFTGSGGKAAAQPSPSGGGADFSSYRFYQNGGSSTFASQYGNNYGLVSGGGGGGGGSGSFLYSGTGYLLVAGGGGSGGSFLTPGGAGGAGGSIGSGGGGGAAGYLRQVKSSTGNVLGSLRDTLNNTFTASGGNGGNGGGNGAGTGGTCTVASSPFNGANGTAHVSTSTFSYNGANSSSYSAAYLNSFLNNDAMSYEVTGTTPLFNPDYSGPRLTRNHEASSASGTGGAAAYNSNTGGANGQGAGAPSLNSLGTFIDVRTCLSIGDCVSGNSGSNGGNNRNTSKGGGAAGGSVSNNRPSDGAAGSVTIYKIF